MNDIKRLLKKYNYKIKKVSFIGKVKIIDTDDNKYVIKKIDNADIKEIFRYLKSKGFNNYLDFINDISDNYLVFQYIDNDIRDDNSKAKDLIYLMALLHSKTYFYKSFPIDQIKKNYESKIDELNNIEKYYEKLKMNAESDIYMTPSNYYLLRNISWIFHSIDSSKYFINKWYDSVKNKKNIRICMTHGNLELNHLIDSDNKLLISWDKAKNDSLVSDIIILYKKYYDKLPFYELISLYNSYFKINDDELYFLFSLMLYPEEVILDKNEVLNMKKVFNLINYLQTSSDIISKYHPSDSNSKDNK